MNAVITLALRVAASFALVSPCLSAEPPQEVDWKNMMTDEELYGMEACLIEHT